MFYLFSVCGLVSTASLPISWSVPSHCFRWRLSSLDEQLVAIALRKSRRKYSLSKLIIVNRSPIFALPVCGDRRCHLSCLFLVLGILVLSASHMIISFHIQNPFLIFGQMFVRIQERAMNNSSRSHESRWWDFPAEDITSFAFFWIHSVARSRDIARALIILRPLYQTTDPYHE